ncbi:MAG: YebC/PmpR family DNA-binding transcriptional regulator [Phycisphaerales bacterium]|jgi:YebC/PmpR family DNA-binding regulatory protein|nr:YebC/PmpR family DNA-binding transcriptional regulator [Phycisphaerales bacterium]
MAGHSKWANIKHRKGRQDALRGKMWSKISKAIMAATKAGGPDPDSNLTLRYAIDEGKKVNMPKDTIKNAIKKASGAGSEGVSFEEVVYEGYGPGGTAFMVLTLTDNRNRTAPELRKLFERAGGQMGSTGCVAYMFQQTGTFTIKADSTDEDTLMEIALDAGADDVALDGDVFEVTCEPSAFSTVKAALEEKGLELETAEVAMIAQNPMAVDVETGKKALTLMENIDEHEDVQKVYTNVELTDEIMAALNE